MKITDTLITLILKQGVLGEMNNFRTEIPIPGETEKDEPRKIIITADTIQIRMDKGSR